MRPFCGRALQLSKVSKLVSGHAVPGVCVASAPRRVANVVEPLLVVAPAAAVALRFREGCVVPDVELAAALLEVLSLTPFATVATLGSSVVAVRSEEHTSELQSQSNLVCRLL